MDEVKDAVASNLFPCPFCLGEAAGYMINSERGEEYAVACQGCGAVVYKKTPEEAVEAWNRRG